MRGYKKEGIYMIPNLMTTGNLFCGFYAIISVFNADYLIASVAILAATIFDSLDGKMARLVKATSKFGVEYDSLADLISFGLAPGLLIYSWALNSHGRIGLLAVFLYTVCGALRLARFNVQTSNSDGRFFSGLPIPAAAAVIASIVLLDHHILRIGKEIKPLLILVITYSLAALMVSTIKYRSFKYFKLKERKPFNFLVSAILLIIVFIAAPQIMFFLVATSYALSGPLERPIVATVNLFRKNKVVRDLAGKESKT
jgi:CDP-diacylglycerol--serine O-phosphatidyltransferase